MSLSHYKMIRLSQCHYARPDGIRHSIKGPSIGAPIDLSCRDTALKEPSNGRMTVNTQTLSSNTLSAWTIGKEGTEG